MDPTEIAVYSVKTVHAAIAQEKAADLGYGPVLDNPAFQAAVEYLHTYFKEHK